MQKTHRDDMRQILDDLLSSHALDCKAVFLFGYHNASEEMLDYLFLKGITVKAILDNNTLKQGLLYRGVPVVPPSSILAFNHENSIVLIAARPYEEMALQLRRLPYDGVIVKVVDYNTFAAYSLSNETLEAKKARVQRGISTLENFRAKYPDHHLVVCPYNALGDVYWAMAFLPAYCKKHGIGKTAVAVTGSGCGETAKLFGIMNLTVLGGTEMDEMVQALLFTREDNCIIAHHDRPYTDNIIRYLDKHFLSFIDYYRCAVFCLPKDTLPSEPSCNETFTGTGMMNRGNTVILAPYAKSVVRPPDSFWEELAGTYLHKGCLVMTCVHGDENPVRGTVPISLPLNQMVSAAEYAGCFIGIRSGLCDIVSIAKCQKTVIFPDCMYSTTGIKTDVFFALPGWEKIVWRASLGNEVVP